GGLLINPPGWFDPYARWKDLVVALKRRGIRVGMICHDYRRPSLMAALVQAYRAQGSWDGAAMAIVEGERSGATALWRDIGSPLDAGVDFVVVNSDWARQFVDPTRQANVFVLHPPVILPTS